MNIVYVELSFAGSLPQRTKCEILDEIYYFKTKMYQIRVISHDSWLPWGHQLLITPDRIQKPEEFLA